MTRERDSKSVRNVTARCRCHSSSLRDISLPVSESRPQQIQRVIPKYVYHFRYFPLSVTLNQWVVIKPELTFLPHAKFFLRAIFKTVKSYLRKIRGFFLDKIILTVMQLHLLTEQTKMYLQSTVTKFVSPEACDNRLQYSEILIMWFWNYYFNNSVAFNMRQGAATKLSTHLSPRVSFNVTWILPSGLKHIELQTFLKLYIFPSYKFLS